MSAADSIIERLRIAGSTGLDLSPGDPLCAEAADLLARAVEVIEWKSLYRKAEMGWYAEALTAKILGQPAPEDAYAGCSWYKHFGLYGALK